MHCTAHVCECKRCTRRLCVHRIPPLPPQLALPLPSLIVSTLEFRCVVGDVRFQLHAGGQCKSIDRQRKKGARFGLKPRDAPHILPDRAQQTPRACGAAQQRCLRPTLRCERTRHARQRNTVLQRYVHTLARQVWRCFCSSCPLICTSAEHAARNSRLCPALLEAPSAQTRLQWP